MSIIKKALISLMVVFSVAGCSEPTPPGTKVLNGEAFIELPSGYTKMSDEMRKIKFPVRTPQEAYASADKTASLVFSLTDSRISESELPKMTEVMKKQYESFNPVFSDEIIDGKKVVVLKVTTPAVDGKIKNIMMFTSLNGKLMVASFNTSDKNEAKYYADGEKSLMNIKWKK